MAWTIEFEELAKKQLAKLDRQAAKRIVDYLTHRLAGHTNPRQLGAAMKGNVHGTYWRYKVGDTGSSAKFRISGLSCWSPKWAIGARSIAERGLVMASARADS